VIFVVTSPSHHYTVKALREGTYGAPTPAVEAANYYQLLGAETVPSATYIFADIERLAPWELRLAASLYRSMQAAGLRCLNNPARVLTRYPLLRALHAAGINPFDAYRADDKPRPQRFPVFLRHESVHGMGLGGLIPDQPSLDGALDQLVADGTPLAGIVVVEYAGEEAESGIWYKWGSHRVGSNFNADHGHVESNWMVTYGRPELQSEVFLRREHDFVEQNAVPVEVKQAFEIGGIEFGRADHGIYRNKTVVFEINTNPIFLALKQQGSPVRDDSKRIARARLAACLAAVDTPAGGTVELTPDEPIQFFRRRVAQFGRVSRP
jgi:hypothetical protein